MKYRQSIVLATLVLFAVAGNSLAQDDRGAAGDDGKPRVRHHGPGRGFGSPDEIIGRIAEQLDLDDAQRQEVSNIMQAARPQFASLRERSRSNRAAFVGLAVDAPDYDAQLAELSAESGELAAELTLLAGRLRADVSAVLTDEQREVLAERMEKFAERAPRSRRHRSE
jgi:Spy/CpxP family protein refolding chaperone